jgi:2-oxoglutarate ferredoxin oxidoreductase subunit delta
MHAPERIRSLLPPHKHSVATAHVTLDRRRCEACWECIDACPREVLGSVSIGRHRHAVVRRPEECAGCMACVKACETGALTRADPA